MGRREGTHAGTPSKSWLESGAQATVTTCYLFQVTALVVFNSWVFNSVF